MKKLFVFALCLMMVFCLSSCVRGIGYPARSSVSTPQVTEQPTQSTPQTPSNGDQTPPSTDPFERTPSLDVGVAYEMYPFLPEEIKSTWREDLITVLSGVEIWIPGEVMGSHAVGLMDLNFDGVPEVLAAYPGGSMGNVFIEIYDLETNSRIVCYDGKGLDDFDDVISLCVAEVNGIYVTLAEGYIRDSDYGWCWLIEQFPDQMDSPDAKTELLFAVTEEADKAGNRTYLCMGKNEVSKSEYDEACKMFISNYRIIKSTQIQMILWSSMEATGTDALAGDMADALLATTQRFIDPQAEDAADYAWKRAYLEVMEAQKEWTPACALVYIDDDAIPELYVNGMDEASGDCVYSYQNGKLFKQGLGRRGGGSYIQWSGMLANVNGHMGHCYIDVYCLNEDGFTQTFRAFSVDVVEIVPEGTGDGYYEFSHEYYVGDEQVTEEEYLAAVATSFDFSGAVGFYEKSVPYHAIIAQITSIPDFDGK